LFTLLGGLALYHDAKRTDVPAIARKNLFELRAEVSGTTAGNREILHHVRFAIIKVTSSAQNSKQPPKLLERLRSVLCI